MSILNLLTKVKILVKNTNPQADVWLESSWEGRKQRNEIVIALEGEKILVGKSRGKWYLGSDRGTGLEIRDLETSPKEILKYLELRLRGERMIREVLGNRDLDVRIEYKGKGNLSIEFENAEIDPEDFLNLVLELEGRGFSTHKISGSFSLEGKSEG